MSEEVIEVVDKDNKVIGLEKRSRVHKEGLIHRASHVFIQNSNKEILIQKRSLTKPTWPDKWDLSVGETLQPGETFLNGALRGLKEELGINDIELTKIRDTYFNGYEDKVNNIFGNGFFQLFVGKYNGNLELDKSEIAEIVFYTPDHIDHLINDNPNNFTSWFLYDWDYARQNNYIPL